MPMQSSIRSNLLVDLSPVRSRWIVVLTSHNQEINSELSYW